MDIIGDVVTADGNAAGSGDRTAEVEGVIRSAAADIDDEGAALALLPLQCHLGGGDGGEDDIIHLHGNFPDQFDAILNTRADAVDDMEIRLDGFAKQADGGGGMLKAIEPIVPDDGVEIDVIVRNLDLAGDGSRFLDVLCGDGGFAVRQAEGATVVDASDVRPGDGEEDTADFHIAGILRLRERILQAGAGLGKIVDLTFSNTRRFGDADAENFYSAIRLYLSDDHAGLAGADLESDVNFGAACHELESIAIEKGAEIPCAAAFTAFGWSGL